MSEYLLEEGRLTPPKLELEHFFEGVQTLSMQVERAQAKVERLMAKAASRRTQ
jgi:ubiquinone biosynthesis protein UbiJ